MPRLLELQESDFRQAIGVVRSKVRRLRRRTGPYLSVLAANSTLLCVHRDPVQLSHLRDHGYELVTTTSRHEGACLFNSRPVNAIVFEDYEGITDTTAIADEIKQSRPDVPIVMLTDHLKLPTKN